MLDKSDENTRLPLLQTTIKNLFALSGNRCAFPGCEHVIINSVGDVVAQIAHIKGVKPTAARFDPEASAEELRLPENLLILCYEHHVETNDESVYTVERMRAIKSEHESRFGGLLSGLRASVRDRTKSTVLRLPLTLEAYARLHKFDANSDARYVEEFREDLVAFCNVLTQLTPDLRSVYATIIERGDQEDENCFTITTRELEEVLALNEYELGQLLGVLTRRQLVVVHHDERDGYHQDINWVSTTRHPGGEVDAPILSEVRHFAEALPTTVSTMIVDLDWNALE